MRAIDNLDLFTNGVTITVEYDSEYYDKTITCSNGVTTYTATTTSSGQTTFMVTESGTWTVTCDGDSTSITVATSHTLSMLPDGKTVLPTDDIQVWLSCAGITDKSYTTLAEVLADTTTLLALINSNNAVDYMVRSTTWAAAVTVPVMTSDTTPSGVVSVSTFYDSNSRGYKAFDGNDSTRWESANVTPFVNVWIQYQFANPITVAKIKMLLPQRNQPATFQLQGSNDGETFTTVQSYTNDSASQTTKEYTNSNTAEYSYWRLLVTSIHKSSAASSWWTGFNTLQFYSASITDNSTAMSYIGLNNYCANTLLADSTWCNAICNSEYFESVLNAKVPVMTSNTTPEGEVSANKSKYPAYYAFRVDGYGWLPSDYDTPNDYVRYRFIISVRVYKFALRAGAGGGTQSYKLQSSSDNVTFTDRSSTCVIPSNESTPSWRYFNATSTENVEYWQIAYVARQSTYSGWLSVQFYGREDV